MESVEKFGLSASEFTITTATSENILIQNCSCVAHELKTRLQNFRKSAGNCKFYTSNIQSLKADLEINQGLFPYTVTIIQYAITAFYDLHRAAKAQEPHDHNCIFYQTT